VTQIDGVWRALCQGRRGDRPEMAEPRRARRWSGGAGWRAEGAAGYDIVVTVPAAIRASRRVMLRLSGRAGPWSQAVPDGSALPAL